MPGIGTSGYLPEGGWQANFSLRYQFSDRHFRGRHEETHRKELGTQVENTVWLADLGVTYGLSARTNLTLSVPYLVAERTGPNRDFPGERYENNATGIGDITLTARRWMLDPEKHLDENVSLGLGIKLPTGEPNVLDARKVKNEAGETELEIRTVDQSIQPGDGGFGFLVDLSAFKQIGAFTPYIAGTYLFNPENTNGVQTFRSRESEAIMSVADQYVARAGTLWTPAGGPVSVGLGARLEGVPVRDLIGGDDGFRRPGYAFSVEPSVVYSRGKSVFSLSVPVALIRNRQRSVPDMQEEGRHGDAAFADWVLLFGWTYRF